MKGHQDVKLSNRSLTVLLLLFLCRDVFFAITEGLSQEKDCSIIFVVLDTIFKRFKSYKGWSTFSWSWECPPRLSSPPGPPCCKVVVAPTSRFWVSPVLPTCSLCPQERRPWKGGRGRALCSTGRPDPRKTRLSSDAAWSVDHLGIGWWVLKESETNIHIFSKRETLVNRKKCHG